MTLPQSHVLELYAAYEAGESLASLARRTGRNRRTLREIFTRRGLAVRNYAPQRPRQANGQFPPAMPPTMEEIWQQVDAVEDFRIPAALFVHWRKWDMDLRRAVIERLRERFPDRPTARPTTPFSANVEPFDYWTPRAREIVARINAGRTSQEAGTKLNINSEGVIYDETLWFFCHKIGYQSGPHIPGIGRAALHHYIWSQSHGPVPRGHIIRHADGNRNNFAPENLVLATRDALCRENQAKSMTAQSRSFTALLLERTQKQPQQTASPYGHTESTHTTASTASEILRRHRRGRV